MNTKIRFYYTDFNQGEFGKTIFEIIIDGTPFSDINDVYEWEENVMFQEIWDNFDFSMIFDRIILGYEETKQKIKPVKKIKHETGRLVFGKTKIKSKSKTKKTSKDFNNDIKKIKSIIKNIKDETKKIINETNEFNEKSLKISEEIKKLKNETETIISETVMFNERSSTINKEIEEIKKETKKLEEDSKKIKKEYTSVWIEPDGTTHELGFAQHNEFASDWLQEKIGLSKMVKKPGHPYEQLQEDYGWLRILGWIDPPQFVFPKRMTVKQKIAVRDYCMNERIGLPERLKS